MERFSLSIAHKYQRRLKKDKPVKRRSVTQSLPPIPTTISLPPRAISPTQSNESTSSEEHTYWATASDPQFTSSSSSSTSSISCPTDYNRDENSYFDQFSPYANTPSYLYPTSSYASWNSAVSEGYESSKFGSSLFYTPQNVWSSDSYVAPLPSWSARTSFASSYTYGEDETN